MRYRWRDLPALARTPVGRSQIRKGIVRRLWPAYARAAMLHRRTRARGCRVVGVVGSFGKTTTLRTVSAALGLDPPERAGNHHVLLARKILGIRPDDRYAVVEAGITEPGQMAAYARVVQPDIAVVTHIGNSHQDRLRTLENTAHEKGQMVRALPDTGLAVLNGDDPRVRAMAKWTAARAITFGLEPGNDVRATDIRVDPPNGTRFLLHIDGSTRDIHMRLLGEPMVYAALAGIAVAHAEGRPLDHAVPAIETLAPASGRLEVIHLNDATVLRDDQKSAIESAYVALDVLERMPAERRIVILHEPTDEMRPNDVAFPPLGARLADVADRLFYLGKPERFEQLQRGAGDRTPPGDAWQRLEPDMVELLKRLPPLGEGDALLFKGPMTARFDRVLLGLGGRTVRCTAPMCDSRLACKHCPMLEPGWGNRRIVI